MKIGLCLEYPIARHGGTEIIVAELIRGLSAQHRIILVSPDDARSLAHSPIAASVHEHIEWRPEPVSVERAKLLAEKIARAKPDIVHFHFGGNYGWGSRIPGQSPIPHIAKNGTAAVSTIHLVVSLLDGYCDSKRPTWFKLALLPLAWLGKMETLKNLRAEVTVSRDGLKKVRRWYWPLRNRFRHIYHSRLESVTGGESARDQTILCVGHIAFRKGQLVLARAFAKIAAQFPDWKLLFIGGVMEPACGKELEGVAARFSNQITLTGERNDTVDLMRRAAIFVQPSFFEGLPLALQEAMANGCACVASGVSGNMELIDNERTGLLVPAGDVDALSAALKRLMVDAALQENFRCAAPAAIIEKKMTAQEMIQQHVELYETILALISKNEGGIGKP
jgi:glycosyltransferase involved in cell wall biosynthesis